MNKDIIRICQMEDDLKRESYLNFLLISNATSLKELEEYYLQNLDYKSILFFEKYSPDKNVLKRKILKENNSELMVLFAEKLDSENIAFWEEKIIETKDGRSIILFAKKIKNANVKKLEDAIINLGIAKYIYEFAVNVPDANIKRLGRVLLELKDVKYITYFTMNFNINILEAQDVIVESKNPKYICLFAEYVVGADINILEDTIISIGDARFIFEFAIKVQNANVTKLLQAFIKNVNKEDYDIINDFADELDRENLQLLKEAFPEAFIIKIQTRIRIKI